jgi:hypothetical protein
MSRLRKPLSYRDALTLMGADDSRAMALLNRLTGVGVSALDVATFGALAFFELRDELVEWGNEAATKLRERVKGVSRLDRTERITAAHAVLVITSFFEALAESDQVDLKKAKLTPQEQLAIATGDSALSYREMVSTWITDDLPMPSALVPFEQVGTSLAAFYQTLVADLGRFFAGLAAFEDAPALLDPHGGIAGRAVERYTMSFRRLAADVPEFAIWAGMLDEQATRSSFELLVADLKQRFETLDTGLAGIRELLAATSSGRAPDRWRAELSEVYHEHLDKPILDTREAPDGIVLPTLGAAYVNPACRIATRPAVQPVSSESWWHNAPLVPDIQAFLVGHLTSVEAIRAPLVILGQPGSGKSLLTRVLAARLPESDFLPVRVELRAVSADADIQDQLTQAVYQTLDRHIEWPHLVDAAQGALPVIMLDGFDELLQAAGVHHADYLEQARNFQERQADLGRPVAIIVTTRTSVADRARFPARSIAVRLEPFDETRVRRWLDAWGQVNRTLLASRDLRPLTPEAALAQGELAGEPLLLLMLALYDAGANTLQREASTFSRAELYEQLLTDFARREVRKNPTGRPAADENRAVERELHQLSLAALAMFNRGQQSVTEQELDDDLAILASSSSDTDRGGMRRPLTAAETIVGRFFFVHEPTARRGTDEPERGFEFLHATFGEFLVARLVTRAVLQLVKDEEYRASSLTPPPLDAGFLYAATSFQPLSSRAPIVEFCDGLFAAHEPGTRTACRSLLLDLLLDALYPHPQWRHPEYEPVRLPAPARYASFSANLVLLAVIAEDDPIDILNARDGLDWSALTSLWRSQIIEWRSLLSALRLQNEVHRTVVRDEDGDITEHHLTSTAWLRREDGSLVRLSESGAVFQLGGRDDGDGDLRDSISEFTAGADSPAGMALREAALFGRRDLEGEIPGWRYVVDDDMYVSHNGLVATPRRLLLELALAEPDDIESQGRVQRYRLLLEPRHPAQVRAAALRLLRTDIRHLTAEVAMSLVSDATYVDYLGEDLLSELVVEYALHHGLETLRAAPFLVDPHPELRAAFERVKRQLS